MTSVLTGKAISTSGQKDQIKYTKYNSNHEKEKGKSLLCIRHEICTQDIVILCSIVFFTRWWILHRAGDVGRRVEAQEDGLGVVGVVPRAAHEVCEGEAVMLQHGGEAQELGTEEEQRVEQHDGRVRPQLLAVPQVILLHP